MLAKPELMKTAFGDFERMFEAILHRNGISTPPRLLFVEKLRRTPMQASFGLIFPLEGIVSVQESVAAEGNTAINRGACGHEIGHVIADHPVVTLLGAALIDRNRLPSLEAADKRSVMSAIAGIYKDNTIGQRSIFEKYRDQEQEADRLSVYLTGSHSDVTAMRRHLAPGTDGFNQIFGTGRDSAWNPLARFRNSSIKRGYVKAQGTQAEIEANIAGVQLDDRSWVQRMIDAREEKIADARSK